MKNKVLVTLKGKPVITVEDLTKEKEEWYKDPQLGSETDREYFDSEAFVRNCMKGLIMDKVVEEYALSYKMREPIEYQKRLDRAMHRLHREIFRESVEIPVSEDEMKAFYQERCSDADGSYEERRHDIESYIKKIKLPKYVDEKIDELKKEYNVEVDESYFK